MSPRDLAGPEDCTALEAGSDSGGKVERNRASLATGLTALYAILLGAANWRHELWYDEMQSWLIARDMRSVPDLMQILRFEGHPALWYLLLSIPAHLTWNPWPAKALTCLFAAAEVWLIFTAPKLNWPVRILAVSSIFIFYYLGTVARSYMLATLLLTAAVRCFLADRPRRKWAIAFLALAINTHILAIPVAFTIAMWGICRKEQNRWRQQPWRNFPNLWRDGELWLAIVVLCASVAFAYITVRPVADHPDPWNSREHSFAFNAGITESRCWNAFLPITENRLPDGILQWLAGGDGIPWGGCTFSLALVALVVFALKSNEARMFFIVALILEIMALAATVRDPYPHHLSFIFDAFLFALMIGACNAGDKRGSWFSEAASSTVILGILGIQAVGGVYASVSAWNHPHGQGKEIAVWLKQRGLDRNPLALDSDHALPVLGYLERPSAYSTQCQCFGSYVAWSGIHRDAGIISADDLKRARANSPLPVIVIHAGQKLDPATTRKLDLVEILSFESGGADWRDEEAYTVYEQEKV